MFDSDFAWSVMLMGGKEPTRAYDSAGFDLYPKNKGFIPSAQKSKIPLGFATEFSRSWVGLILDRGSTGNFGLFHLAGVIDSDFRGEWEVILFNLNFLDYHYSPDKAITQVVFVPCGLAIPKIVDQLTNSIRDIAMLGSSDGPKIHDTNSSPVVHDVSLGFSMKGKTDAV